jgi:hypothetical protein
VDWGTATAPIYLAHDRGLKVHVWVDETRPRNQGASLTAWELGHHGVPHTVIADNTGGHLMQHRMVDLAIVGTDRVTANGDVCNKIGTYLKALAAHDNGVPFYVALPSPTIDFSIDDGIKQIPIEAAQRRRSGDHDRPHRRRTRRDRAGGSRRLACGQLRVRCHAGAAGDGLDHRTRPAPAGACCTCERIPGAQRGTLTPATSARIPVQVCRTGVHRLHVQYRHRNRRRGSDRTGGRFAGGDQRSRG